jgi:hypothetical protein
LPVARPRPAARGANASYIGTLDGNWNPVHSAALPKGDAGALLRSLPRF